MGTVVGGGNGEVACTCTIPCGRQLDAPVSDFVFYVVEPSMTFNQVSSTNLLAVNETFHI